MPYPGTSKGQGDGRQLSHTCSNLEKFQKTSDKTESLLQDIAKQVSDDPHLSQDLKSKIKQAVKAHENYSTGFMALSQKVIADPGITPQKANKLMGPLKQNIYEFEEGTQLLGNEAKHMIEEVTEQLSVTGNHAQKIIMIFIAAGVALSLFLGFLISNAITKPVSDAVRFAEKMASGDFSQEIDADRRDEIGQFLIALNQMANQLKETIQNVVSGINTLTDSSTELSTISEQLTSDAEDTSGRSDSVATAAEEMTSNLHSLQLPWKSLQRMPQWLQLLQRICLQPSQKLPPTQRMPEKFQVQQ